MLKRAVDLAPYTYIQIGGVAEAFWEVRSRQDLDEALAWRRAQGLEECLVLGGGANLLINDERTYPFVLKMERQFGTIRPEGDRIVAEAGLYLSRLVRVGVREGWGGLEQLAGIPGTIGGAVVMNAGIPSFETFDLVREVAGLDPEGDEVRFSRGDLLPGYRTGNIPPGIVVTEVALERRPGDPSSMAVTAKKLKDERRAKQPLQYPSFGSTFMNPPRSSANGSRSLASGGRAHSARPAADASGLRDDGWGASAAGALIERAGLKGARCGDAQLSELHANFVVNLGHARARDVLELMSRARRAVAERFGVFLVPEVRLVGFDPRELAPLFEPLGA